MKVALIVDGSQRMGIGNVARGIALAEELQTKATVLFVTKSEDIVVDRIKDAGFNVRKSGDDNETISLLSEIEPDVVIIDKLGVPKSLARGLKETLDTRLVIFDNLSGANKYADIVVNCVMGSNYENRKYLDRETNTFYFYGLRYEVLRREFYAYRKSPSPKSNKPNKLLVLLGGSDPSNLATAVLDELLGLDRNYDIDIVAGLLFEHLDELARVLAKYPDKEGNVEIHKNIGYVAQLMYEADLAIVSPGLSVFEALLVRLPIIVIHKSPYQQYWFKKFLPTLGKDEIGKIGSIIERGEYANPFGEYIRGLEVGKGKDEVIEAILEGVYN